MPTDLEKQREYGVLGVKHSIAEVANSLESMAKILREVNKSVDVTRELDNLRELGGRLSYENFRLKDTISALEPFERR